MKLIVSIVGRPNVGKSTLFNRLTKSRNALVANFLGLTRDRHYGEGGMGKKKFILIDTGGFEPLVNEGILYQMARQTELAIMESDVVIMVVDGKGGITPQDKLIANQLRRTNKPIYVAINKVEGVDKVIALSDFYELGIEQMFAISSAHGDGIYALMEKVLTHTLNLMEDETEAHNRISFAVIGRPNVGKSTLVNTILGEERVITFDQPGTTRDSINIDFNIDEQHYRIIDTAGIRRKGRVVDKIEKFSILKTLQSISEANVVVLVLDAHLDIAEQDATIMNYAVDAGKAIVIAINKWDNLKEELRIKIKAEIKRKLNFLDYAQFVYLSALYKKGIKELFTALHEAYAAAFIKMSTPKVSRVLKEAVDRQSPVYHGNFRPKLRYAHQGGVNPPIIVIHGNSLENLQKTYSKYLERSFRKVFDLMGTPLRIEYKNSTNPFNKE